MPGVIACGMRFELSPGSSHARYLPHVVYSVGGTKRKVGDEDCAWAFGGMSSVVHPDLSLRL